MGKFPRQFGEHLHRWAEKTPDRVLFAERGPNGEWINLTYGDALQRANRVSQALLDRGHDQSRPVACLSDKSLDMAVLKLAAMQIGIPFLPISSSYSLASSDFARLKYVMAELRPSLIYVSNVRQFAPALKALPSLEGVDLIASEPGDEFPDATSFQRLLSVAVTPQVRHHFEKVGPDSIAKLLLTSGSTGMPKAVINTHGTICANGMAVDTLWPFLADQPHVVLDWLPWNHTFGSNTTFNQTLRHGGTLYMDEGKPVPGKFETTVRNMRDVRPTIIYNVPRGLDMLVPILESDSEFGRAIFDRLKMIFYSGAALPSHLWHRIDAISIKYRGMPMPIFSSLGSTETGPVATLVHWASREPAGVGLPIPGTTLKLVPVGGKLEMRVKGVSISPGYFRRPDLTELAFDVEGYFKLGDAVRFVDPERPEAGLAFDGRISENFKLTSGVWVQAGEIRVEAINSGVPFIQDVVVAGHDRDEIGVLVFLNLDGCRQACGNPSASLADLAEMPIIRNGIRQALQKYNQNTSGSSRHIARAILLGDAPSIDANEITDKGYLNQRIVLERRADEVRRLFDANAPDTIVIDDQLRPAPARAESRTHISATD
ncbi:MAG: feruloyl-CoA synthase [Alphaproteobacteria bacterium]